MADLFHECGIAAVYHLKSTQPTDFCPAQRPEMTARLMPRMLLDIQNRGQLAAGMTTFDPSRNQLIDTHKDVGSVTEVFHLNHRDAYNELMSEYGGPAAIGHVRYATCGKDDKSYAQPFERHHIQKSKWFSFAFNGQLANYQELCQEILSNGDFHLARETDTEILMHLLSQELSDPRNITLLDVLNRVSGKLDGAYNIVFLNAHGDMFVARDPLGIRPVCYAIEGSLFAAASESVALANLGFATENIKSLEPGWAIFIENGHLEFKQFLPDVKEKRAHCFFEWIYFANVCSTLDDRSVYLIRKRLGEELARLETVPTDDDETIVVPVPDTAKAAADSMAFHLKIPSLEGLIRNRYVGRTFIEGNTSRADKVRAKYTPLPEVLSGKRVLLVEDTIVRSTTMKVLISQLRERGGAREVHVRVACPPIIAPCFYGIDMSTVSELFAPKFIGAGAMTVEAEREMADAIGADSLRYLPTSSIARCVDLPRSSLCQACIDTVYPTESGKQLYQLALGNADADSNPDERTYDIPLVTART